MDLFELKWGIEIVEKIRFGALWNRRLRVFTGRKKVGYRGQRGKHLSL